MNTIYVEQCGVWSKGFSIWFWPQVSPQLAADELTLKGVRLRREMNQPQPSLLRILAALFIFIMICYHFQHFVLFPDPMIRINGTSSCTGSPKNPFRCLDCLHLILINYTSSWIIRSNYSELKWFLLIAFFWAQIISPNCIFPAATGPLQGQ